MTERKKRPPIVIIGMHRSGTSMLVRFLEEGGMFIGARKDIHDESLFFIGLNDWLLHQSSATWDNPEPVANLAHDEQLRDLVTEYLKLTVRSPRIVSFLGITRYLRWRSLESIDIPWGWKDPRSTFTLGFWQQLFPDLRVIHIKRHGVDVAESLRRRREKKILRSADRLRRFARLHQIIPKSQGFTDSVRCGTLSGGFELWESYVDRADQIVAQLGDRAIALRYEDFLFGPQETLERLTRFCDLEVSPALLEKAQAQIDESRAYAYRNSVQLQDFADSMANELDSRGYPAVSPRP